MTCSMDTLLMTLFLLWHRGLIPLKALKNDPSPLKEIFKLIENHQHAEARKKWLDYELGLKTTEFFKSKQGDNPFDCTAGILHVVRNCSLFIFGEKQISEECSQCQRKGSVRSKVKSFCVASTVRTDISCPQEKILDGKGYNGKVSLVCQEHQAIPLEDKPENLNASHKKCGGTFLYESIIREPHPWILCVSSPYASDIEHGHTGVDSLSSLERNIQIRGVHYHLGAVMFANDSHFCSIAVDPIPQGDVNIFYDGVKRGDRRTTFVPFKGSFKEVVGSYDITALWYVRQKSSAHMTAVGNIQNSMAYPVMQAFPSLTSAALPEVWNDGEDLEYTYHGAQYNDTTLCEIAPFVLNHLADRNTYWNETIMRTFVTALDYHLNTNIPSVGSYFLTPTVLTIDEINIENTGKKGKKQKPTLRVKLYGFDDELLETWKKYNSFVFLLHYRKINDDGNEEGAHYVVVTVEFGKDFWWATVTGDDVYGSLPENIWNETVHFIAKQFGLNNRSHLVFKKNTSRAPAPSPSKWYSYKSVMPDDGEYDDGCSCGPHSCNFLLNMYNKLGRIDPKIMPDIRSELLRVPTKIRMIPVLTKLMKPLAELLNNDDIFSKVNSVTGEGADEIAPDCYTDGPEKYSIKNLNLSLLSLSGAKIYNLVFGVGCPCKRTLFSGAPYIRCGSCHNVYHIECFFAYVKNLDGDKIFCLFCQQEVGCNTDMLLVPPRRQLPVWNDYIFDGVLVLDFLKCGNWSKIERRNIRENYVKFFEKRYGETWAFVSPYKHNESAKKAIIPPNIVALTKSTTIDTSVPEGGISKAGETSLTELKDPESFNIFSSNEDEISRKINNSNDEESREKGDSSLLKSASPECSWSLSSKGCILPGVEPKDVCGSWGCQHVFHHLCQTEWEFFQYRLDYPQGDPKDCTYDSGGKKRCIHHHPYHNLAIKTIQPSTAEVSVVNCPLSSSEASKVVEQHSTADTGASNLFMKGVGVKEIRKDESSMVAAHDAKVFNVPLIPDPSKSPVLAAIMSKEMYIKEIQTMFPDMNCGRLSSNITFSEDWVRDRARAAEYAFNTVKKMISDKKLVYDNRTSLSDDESFNDSNSDDESSDGLHASLVHKTTRKTNLDDDDKKFFTSLPTCYSMFSAFDSRDVVHSYCPFAKLNECWREKNTLVTILDGYDCKNKAFQSDGLRQHISTQHSKSWCGMGVQIFLQELYPEPTVFNQRANTQSSSNKSGQKHKRKKIQSISLTCQCQL